MRILKENLNLTNGLTMAERLMAELTRSGMGRKQTAYGIVRRNAIKANKEGGLLGELILEEEDVQKYPNTLKMFEKNYESSYIYRFI